MSEVSEVAGTVFVLYPELRTRHGIPFTRVGLNRIIKRGDPVAESLIHIARGSDPAALSKARSNAALLSRDPPRVHVEDDVVPSAAPIGLGFFPICLSPAEPNHSDHALGY